MKDTKSNTSGWLALLSAILLCVSMIIIFDINGLFEAKPVACVVASILMGCSLFIGIGALYFIHHND